MRKSQSQNGYKYKQYEGLVYARPDALGEGRWGGGEEGTSKCAAFGVGSTFFQPDNPSDSMKKYANGRRRNKDTLHPTNTVFQRPVGLRGGVGWVGEGKFSHA